MSPTRHTRCVTCFDSDYACIFIIPRSPRDTIVSSLTRNLPRRVHRLPPKPVRIPLSSMAILTWNPLKLTLLTVSWTLRNVQ